MTARGIATRVILTHGRAVQGRLLHETWSSWPIFKTCPARCHNEPEGNTQRARGTCVFGVRPEPELMMDAKVILPFGRENGGHPACALCVRAVDAGARFAEECPPLAGCSTFLLRMAA